MPRDGYDLSPTFWPRRHEGILREQLLAELRRQVREAGGLVAFCKSRGIHKACYVGQISQVLAGRAQPQEGVAKLLGYEAVTLFRKVR